LIPTQSESFGHGIGREVAYGQDAIGYWHRTSYAFTPYVPYVQTVPDRDKRDSSNPFEPSRDWGEVDVAAEN
jgi:hypothetical protein